MKGLFLIIFIAAFFVISANAQTDYAKEIEKWRVDQEAELKADNGWLTVAGLFWLKEGVNTIGAGSGYDIELTENFKGKFGEIIFQNGAANLKVENGVEATNDGKIISELPLVSDEKGKPSVIQIGSQTFYLIKREDRFGIRLKDKNNKERTEFHRIDNGFRSMKNTRSKQLLKPFAEPKEVLIPNVLGGNFKMKSPGVLRFKLNGKKYALEPVLRKTARTNFLSFSATRQAAKKPTARDVFYMRKSGGKREGNFRF